MSNEDWASLAKLLFGATRKTTLMRAIALVTVIDVLIVYQVATNFSNQIAAANAHSLYGLAFVLIFTVVFVVMLLVFSLVFERLMR